MFVIIIPHFTVPAMKCNHSKLTESQKLAKKLVEGH